MAAISKRLVLLVTTLVIAIPSGGASDVVCREPGVMGFDAAAARAHQFLPEDTSDPSKAFIYVEKTKSGYYFHSNFITPGYNFTNPTKIASDHLNDVLLAFYNIRFYGGSDEAGKLQMKETYRNDVHVLLDQSVFSAGGYPLVDVKDAKNVAVVNGATGKILTDGTVDTLTRTSPPPMLLSKVVGCCLYGIPPHLAPRYQQALRQRNFVKSDVRFLSLIRDSGTEEAISYSSNLASARLGEARRPITNISQIESSFQLAQGKTVMMISHVEGTDFVVRDSAQNVISSIPIDTVRTLAKKYNIQLIDLGCRTAQEIEADSLGLGVTTKFNTVVAVKALERAVSQSNNYADFFQTLTSENLKIVVDEGFMHSWPLCADVYAKATASNVWIKLARIFVSFRDKQPIS